jgi:hypothetical protein
MSTFFPGLIFHIKVIPIAGFYPTGEPISLHRLRRSPLAVDSYSFAAYFLPATVISTRKYSRIEIFIKSADVYILPRINISYSAIGNNSRSGLYNLREVHLGWKECAL